MPEHRFADRLAAALDRAGSPVCVGLDPVLERLPEAVRAEHWEPVRAIEAFCRGVIDAIADHVTVVKPQSACFERYGSAGVRALEHTCEHARSRGLVVILDAKRGDIGVSAQHYAAAGAHLGADAITVNAYLGPSTVEPYLDAGLGVFVLVRTSNPDSDAVQSVPLAASDATVAGMMADHVRELGASRRGPAGLSDVGAVVGATKASDGRALRERMPDQVFLIPGYGAQGGSADDVRAMLREDATSAGTSGVVVTASRSVIYPEAGSAGDWHAAISDAASAFVGDVRGVLGAT
ncbi:MAG: orotidine-5'-phosphate decarboxylase [Phycisphaerales bacterium JB041]